MSSKTKKSRSVWGRLDTLKTSGFDKNSVLTAGPLARLKQLGKLHNPKTYLALLLIAGLRLSWCFRNPYYWFAVAFCGKWYRAKYVFKIPVWDRQPNWNNIITSKEQEKDLKAYTCLKCGSTIFIAKTREFFFEGPTGIGGLGCFACGVKGKENFVMDRDRIVEEVADEDDYFDYERPLDFVSRAERRQLMKEADGNVDRANQILIDRASEESSSSQSSGSSFLDAEIETAESTTTQEENVPVNGSKLEESKSNEEKTSSTKPVDIDPDDLDALDMDNF